MKLILTGLLLVGTISTQASEKDFNKKNQHKYSNRILKCIRKTINQKRGGIESARVALKYLTELKTNYSNNSKLEEIAKSCKEERRGLEKQKEVYWKDIESELVAATKNQITERTILRGFIYPKATCILKGANVNIALGGKIGVGLRISSCLESNGKRYDGLLPEGELGYGYGGNFLTGSKTVFSYYPRQALIGTYQSYTVRTGGSGLVQAKDEQQAENVIDKGIGFSYGRSKRAAPNFIVTPIRNDFSKIKEKLFQ